MIPTPVKEFAMQCTWLERHVIMLRYNEELEFAEIAAVLELDEGHVRVIHDRIVDEVRRPRAAK